MPQYVQTDLMTFDTAEARKARGAFFTPPEIAQFIVDWAIRGPGDAVLEPSCGEAVFLLAAGRRLRELGATNPDLHGADLHEATVRAAHSRLAAHGLEAQITRGDFFEREALPSFDAVVGNPPFIRYQAFRGSARARARGAALSAGVALSGLASSWAAFLVHSVLFLNSGGRLGMVVPAELLTVNYAAPVRSFLLAQFSSVHLVHFVERVFGPDVQEEVVLVLADGHDPDGPGTDHFDLFEAHDAAALRGVLSPRTWRPSDPSERWSDAYLGDEALVAYQQILASGHMTPLSDWGDTTLGIVTGNNKFFALSPARAKDLGMAGGDTLRVSPPGSAHLRRLKLSTESLDQIGRNGAPTRLFRPELPLSPAAEAYIAAGEATGVDQAYKCRVRKPWWRVPLPAPKRPPDLFLTYMNADTARLCSNDAQAWAVNSVHGVYLTQERRATGTEFLPLAALNSITMLGAELVGRSYGGGVLKLEPKEADGWPMPSPALIERVAEDLSALADRVDNLVASGRLDDAVTLVDEVLLGGGARLSRGEIASIRDARDMLAARRKVRGRG